MENSEFISTLTEDQVDVLYTNTKIRMVEYSERAGQALFNTLNSLYPKIAGRVKGSNYDPFYNSENINACLKSILPVEIQGQYIHKFIKLAKTH